MKLTEILKNIPKKSIKIASKPLFLLGMGYFLVKTLTTPVYAGDTKLKSDNSFWDSVEKTELVEKKSDSKVKAYARLLGLASFDGPDYFGGDAKVVFKPGKGFRIGAEGSVDYGSDSGIDALATNLGAYLGKYFISRASTVYAQLGVDLAFSNSESKDSSLDETLYKIKTKFGLDNSDFRGDISLAFGFGNYSGKLNGTKQEGSAFSFETKGNARFKTGSDFDIEAGFEFIYKELDNLWTEFASNFGAGIVYNADDDLAMKLSAYFKHSVIDSGRSIYTDSFGVQYEVFSRVLKTKDFTVTLNGAIRYDTKEGFGAFASIGISTK